MNGPQAAPLAQRRPASPIAAVATYGALVLVVVTVASSLDVGPAMASLAFALVVLVGVGAIISTVTVRRVRVERLVSPPDLTVGDTTELEVTIAGVGGEVMVRALDPAGPWHRTRAGRTVRLPHSASRRGIFDRVRVEVRVSSPVSFVAATDVIEVQLDAPTAIGPAAIDVTWHPGRPPVDEPEATSERTNPSGETTRSVRPYEAGDPARLVHWPSTARTGELVVRELEPPETVGQVVVLDLVGLGDDDVELAASYAMGAASAVLADGGRLVLCTHGSDGPRTDHVRSRLHASRLLAAAVVGPPGPAPVGWPVVELGR